MRPLQYLNFQLLKAMNTTDSSPNWRTVHHTSFRQCLEAIKQAHATHQSGRPRSVRIIGHTGVGKTALINEMLKLHPRTTDRHGICVPVLHVEIPANPTEKTLLIEMLRALGDPVPTSGTRALMEIRLHTFLQHAQVQLIVVDEVQHFVVHAGRVTLNASADMFKSLINRARVPIALLGTRSARELFFMNSQLRSRIPLEFELRAFDWDVENQKAEFLAVFKAQFPLGFNNDDFLFLPQVARRLWFATNGLLRPMRDLCQRLREIAKDHKELTQPLLSQAFRTSIWNDPPATRDPFDPRFNMTTLEGPGEPFERDVLEGGTHDSPLRVPASSLARKNRHGGTTQGGVA